MADTQMYTKTDVDRLLGLVDQFLDDWAEDAVQGGKRDTEYEERFAEWGVMRRLLLAAPEMLRGLNSIAAFCDGSPDPVARCCLSIARKSLASLPEDHVPSAEFRRPS